MLWSLEGDVLVGPELDAALKFGSWSEPAAVGVVDGGVVDAGFAAAHQSVLVELPQLVAVAAEPLSGVVVPFVLEADGDAVVRGIPRGSCAVRSPARAPTLR